jgi:hypothetical protein
MLSLQFGKAANQTHKLGPIYVELVKIKTKIKIRIKVKVKVKIKVKLSLCFN